MRYNTDGTLDDGSAADTTPGDAFGTGGKVIVSSGGFYTPWLQADGKIVASGFGTIARFNSDGTLDDGFGTGGMVLQHANVGAIQSDGKILTVGTASNGVNDDIIVYRLNPDGTTDTNFGIGGAARIDAGGNEGSAWAALAVGSDGSIVVVGYQTNADQDSLIARLTSQGKPDETFAPGGVVVQSFSTSGDMFRGVALQPDGRIVAVGNSLRTISRNALDNDFLVARYLGNPTIGPVTANPNLVSARSAATLTGGNISTSNSSCSITQVANLGGAILGLGAGNTNPQGIADPPATVSSPNNDTPLSAADQLFSDLALLLSDAWNAYQSELSSLAAMWQSVDALALQRLDALLSMESGATGVTKDILMRDLRFATMSTPNS